MTRPVPITAQIEQATSDIPGWTPQDQLQALFTLAFSTADLPGDILELGSWCGRSAVVLGMAARLSGKGKVHCIDLFPERNDWYRNSDGTYSLAVMLGERKLIAYSEQTVWAEPYERDIAPVYERYPAGTLAAFSHAMAENRLTDLVLPFKGDLISFTDAAPAGLALRLAFIDGDHSYAAVTRDIALIERFLIPGGWLCFDDAFSHYEGVDRAIRDHVIESGKYQCCQQISRKLFIAQRRRA